MKSTAFAVVTSVPVVIEEGDRRYTVVCGGLDRNLAHEGWFDYRRLEEDLPAFMLHLLSRPADLAAAGIPLVNAKKLELMGLAEDSRIDVVREWVESHRGGEGDFMTGREVADAVNETQRLRAPLTPKKLATILRHLGVRTVVRHKTNCYVGLVSFETEGEFEKPNSPSEGCGGAEAAPGPEPKPESGGEAALEQF